MRISRLYKLRLLADRLLLAIVGTAIGLAVLVVAIAVFWGPGPVLAEIVWFVPMVATFISLAGICVSFLALGRYQVQRDPVSFWVGLGFATLSVGHLFYVLSWPGLLPDGRSIIAQLGNTPALIIELNMTLFSGVLLAAVLVRWPGKRHLAGRRWLGVVTAWLIFVTLAFILIVSFEQFMPVIVNPDGTFTLLLRNLIPVHLLLFAVGSVLSTRHYLRTGDTLAGHVAFTQMALVFILLMTIVGGKRYDLWWYLQRLCAVCGYLIVLFGLLSEYVHLLRRERQKTRDLRAYAAQLERSNRDLQEFTYAATHGLQEPLRKIEFFADKLLADSSGLAHQPRKRLVRMAQAAGQMRSMVEGLSHLSRLAVQPQQLEQVALAMVIAQALAELEAEVQHSGGRVEVGPLPSIEADRSQLRELFRHLIQNALKFQPPGAKPHIQISAKPGLSDCVQVVVQDNGIGFEEEWAERIFEPFQRMLGNNEFYGTGIGLAICRKVVERHKGVLTVTSKRGQGSRFIVTVPVKQTVEETDYAEE